MAALGVDKVYRFVQFVANKESRGWIDPEEFNINAELAQLAAYSKREAVFLASKVILNDMRPFMKKSGNLTPTAGIIAYPADMRHFITAVDSTGTRVTEHTQAEWSDVLESTIIAPTSAYPACVQRGDGLDVYPITTQAYIEYIASPTAPEWAYTLVSSRPVYASGSSTDFGFDEVLFLEISMLILANCGVNIGADNVTQYGMAFNQAK